MIGGYCSLLTAKRTNIYRWVVVDAISKFYLSFRKNSILSQKILHVINLDSNQPVDPYHNPELQQQVLRNREERVLSMVRQAKRYFIGLQFWEGDLTDNVFRAKNVARIFKKIVAYAKEERLPHITIAEDDLIFTSKKSWQYYLDNWPDDFDLYLGGIYAGRLDGNRIIDRYNGHTLITVHERFYDVFLRDDPNEHHLDSSLGNLSSQYKFIVTIPFVVKQMGGYSENKKRVIDLSGYEKDWAYLT